MPENIPSPESELQALCLDWQRRLRLQDWRVTVSFAVPGQMSQTYHHGECATCAPRKLARIKVLRPDCHPGDEFEAPYDMEAILVHELLHLHTNGMNIAPSSAEDVAMEQMVDLVAEALVALKRGEN